MNDTKIHSFHSRGRWFAILAAAEALAALVALAVIPRESSAFSLARIGLLGLLGAVVIAWSYFAIRPPHFFLRPSSSAPIYLMALLCFLLGAALFLLRYLYPESLAAYYRRLGVVLWYFFILGVEAFLFLLVARNGLQILAIAHFSPLVRPSAVALGVLFAAAVFIAVTRLGLTPDPAYWGESGVPVLGWQLALALLAGLAVLPLGSRIRDTHVLDFCIGAAIWALAAALWLSVPLSVMRNSFYAPINPPAFQAFPNSDAGYYDSMAQSLLIGYPYQGDIPARPLYIVGLTLLHLVLGERYDLIVLGQTLVLAFIPVALYVLGRSLHSRTAGVSMALIAIFREFTSLLVSSETRVSNTKMLLVDLPTMLLILIACLAAFRWFQRRDTRSSLIAGGAFGVLLLLRTQAALILPLLLVLSIAVHVAARRPWLRAVALFMLALVLSVAPWLLHNYLFSGHLAFDAPFQYRIIASQYRYTGNLDINSIDLKGKSLAGIVWTFALQDPKFVLGFIANHALATQVGGLLVLPLIETYNGLLAPINMYWLSWGGTLTWPNVLLVCGYLTIIAIGLGAVWRRFHWAGLAPLAFSLGYSLANGLARFSGWRYDLPADWISYFYFSIGVAEILTILAMLLGARNGRDVPPPINAHVPVSRLPTVLPILVLVLVGASPWLAEGFAQPRYAPYPSSALIHELASSPSVQRLVDVDQLDESAAMPGAVLEVGRDLYPRFFTKGSGLASAHPWPAYAPRDFPRLGFLLLNQTRHDVVLPIRQPPGDLPHAGDVIVLGCQEVDYVEARLVLALDSGVAYLNGGLTDRCP